MEGLVVLYEMYPMAKQFDLTISDARLIYRRKTVQLEEEAALDGLHAVRTSLPKETLEDADAVKA